MVPSIKCYSDISCKQVAGSSGGSSSIYTVIGVIGFKVGFKNNSSSPLFQSYHRIREDRIKCLNSTYSELQGINYCLTRLFQVIDPPNNLTNTRIPVHLYCDNISAVSIVNRAINPHTPDNPFSARSERQAQALLPYVAVRLSIDEMISSIKSLNYQVTITRIPRNQNRAHVISRQGVIQCYINDVERRKLGLQVIKQMKRIDHDIDHDSSPSEHDLIQSAYEKHSKPEDLWH